MPRWRCRRQTTTPAKAPPGSYRFLAEFEPLRQITGGVRSILSCGANSEVGLARC
ncbi:hypothetical protein ABZU94_38960 [Streptomyces mirabilis]|uniref:hypothetical protein n=1 Tax=Streptomyces sp. NPDC005388 TaxID=3156717 RepID=UPI0033BC0DE4